MLSKSSTYAIRAVLYLSLHADEPKKFNPKSIAEAIGVPAPFLAKILQILSKTGLVSSVKGRGGGFYLTKENKENSLLSVIDSIDGLRKFHDCMLGLPVCGDKNPCSVHHVVFPLRRQLIDQLTQKSISDLTEEVRKGDTHIFLNDL